MRSPCFTFFLFLSSVTFIAPASILLLPYPWPSHILQLEILGKELARRGHQVTLISSIEEHYHADAYKYMNRIIYKTKKARPNAIFELARDTLQKNQQFGLGWLYRYLDILNYSVEEAIDDPQVRKVSKTADLVLTDFSHIPAATFSAYFNLSMAAISPLGYTSDALGDVLGIPDNPSYMPGFLSASSIEMMGFAQEMSLLERTYNLMSVLLMKLARRYLIIPHVSPINKKYQVDSLIEEWKKTKLLLLPMDFAVEPAVPLPPLVKVVRPFTLRDADELPLTLKAIFNIDQRDVLLITFGAMDTLSSQNIEALVETLSQLDMIVLWKFNRKRVQDALRLTKERKMKGTKLQQSFNTVTPQLNERKHNFQTYNTQTFRETREYLEIGGNIYVFSWLPQNDLLGNSRVKLFLSHCGRNGMYESIYHKVPLICMPLFGDQWNNAGIVIAQKLGMAINKGSQLNVKLQFATKEIRRNAVYKENVDRASERLRGEDRVTLRDTAILIERVINNTDTAYLRPSMADLNFYERSLLDVYLLLAISAFLLVYLLLKLRRIFVNILFVQPDPSIHKSKLD